MKHKFSIWILILLTSCSLKKENSPNNIQKEEKVKYETPIYSEKNDVLYENLDNSSIEKLNLDSTLIVDSLDKKSPFPPGSVIICCYQLFDISNEIKFSNFNKSIEQYEPFGEIEKVEVYRSDDSFVKIYFNKQYETPRKDIVCGKILTNNLLLDNKIQIGMKKSDFLEIIFKTSDLFCKVDQLIIYEDDMGEAWTIYKFENNQLSEIVFDSAYDWVERK